MHTDTQTKIRNTWSCLRSHIRLLPLSFPGFSRIEDRTTEETTPMESTVVTEGTTRGTAVPGEAVEMTAGREETDSGKTDARATKEATVAVGDTSITVMATDETQGTIHISRGLGGTTDLLQQLSKPVLYLKGTK